MTTEEIVAYARKNGMAVSWANVSEIVKQMPGESIYDWCWVCGLPLGPDKMHVMIDNGRVLRHTYCCRKHRYVVVEVTTTKVPGATVVDRMIQTRSDSEIENLAWAFKDGKLEAGWE